MTPNLLKDPIPTLFKAIAVPASVGYFFNTMYNVIDTYYAGQLSVEAIAALSISFPVFFMIIALGVGVSQGTTAILSNVLGEENPDDAVHYAHQAIVFGVIMSAILTAVGLVASPSLFRLLGAEDNYLETALAYMDVIMYGTVFFMLNFILNGILSAHGDTRSHRNMLFLGFLLNLVLNPIFMFGFAFIPELGIAGIAWATVFIQVLTTVYLAFKVRQRGQLQFALLSPYKPDSKALGALFMQGYPASLNMFTVALGIFIITFYLSEYGKTAVTTY
ncbi:MAG: MATE family efflux transporter, partial [Planctomycetota bacterium]|nr:MATE family efflux transporter [Planctomycetota bacterium]